MFKQRQEPFIHFLLAISFASPGELGYDPTVQRVLVDDQVVYEYKVFDKDEQKYVWYRTIGDALYNHRAR